MLWTETLSKMQNGRILAYPKVIGDMVVTEKEKNGNGDLTQADGTAKAQIPAGLACFLQPSRL